MKSIETSNGIYEYEEKEFILGTKKIDIEISKKNLLLFRKCLNNANIPFGLLYGTLLGAVRENNFIEHDEDTDVFVLYEYKDQIIDILFELKKYGLIVARNDIDVDLLSFIKDGEYIDIYFFRKNFFGQRISNGLVIDSKYLERLIDIHFLGVNFQIPNNPKELLEKIYGHDWMIPRIDVKGSNYGLYRSFKEYIKKYFKILIPIVTFYKKKILNKKY